MENINRKHLRCYRKLQLWRVFHIVLAGDWMRLLPIQTFISMERRNVSDSMYLLWRGMKSIKNRYYCSLCFHWPGNQQKHLGLRQLSCTVVGAVNEVTETSHQHPDIPAGMLSVGHTCLAGSVCSCLGSCFPKCRMLCPLSLTSGRARGISELLLWDKTPESPPHQQPGPGKVRVRSEAPWAAAEWSNAELCFF